MNAHVSALVSYFKIELPRLKNNYQWKIPQIDGFARCGEKGYEPNVELKKYLNEKWSPSNAEEKLSLTKVIVSDWGGVKNNKLTTLQTYVNEFERNIPSTPLKGVASYSKIFAIAGIEKYAIYDARVAVCLNAIQWNSNIRKGIAFNYIPGRNNVTGHAGKRIGFAYCNQFKTEELIKRGWRRIKRDDTYKIYLDTLYECLKHFEEYSLYDLEMVLFANAENECLKAMNSVSNT